MNVLGRDRSPSGPSDPVDSHSGGFGETALPSRKHLSHQIPPWIADGAIFFITVNCLPRRVNQLTVPATAAGLMESVFVRARRGDWWPQLVLLMPDHLHALMAFAPDRPLSRVISDWKRYAARHLGVRWQRDLFDHRIRNEKSLAEKWDYILHNPVRAGLVARPEDWPYVWIGRDRSPSGPLRSQSDHGGFGKPPYRPVRQAVKTQVGTARRAVRPIHPIRIPTITAVSAKPPYHGNHDDA